MNNLPEVSQEDIIEETVAKALSHFKLTEKTAKGWLEKAQTVKVKDETDKEGYERATTSYNFIMEKYKQIEQKRVDLKKVHLETGRAIDKEAKRLFALLDPIKGYLVDQREIVNAPIRDRKAKAEQQKREVLATRIAALLEAGMVQEGDTFTCEQNESYNVTIKMITEYTDDLFATFIGMIPPKVEPKAEPAPAVQEEEPAVEPTAEPDTAPTRVNIDVGDDLFNIRQFAETIKNLELKCATPEGKKIADRTNREIANLFQYLKTEYKVLQSLNINP